MIWVKTQGIYRKAIDGLFAFEFSDKKRLTNWAKMGSVEIEVDAFKYKSILRVSLVFVLLACNSCWDVSFSVVVLIGLSSTSEP